jgi:hypothetical protein
VSEKHLALLDASGLAHRRAEAELGDLLELAGEHPAQRDLSPSTTFAERPLVVMPMAMSPGWPKAATWRAKTSW